MSAVVYIKGREILDSRGYPTLETEVRLASGACGSASVPSGASVGQREALEWRDHDPMRYQGRGVLGAVRSLSGEIQDALCGQDALDQTSIDRNLIQLDGTPNKSRLGANTLLSVSWAVAQAAAAECGKPLYEYIKSDCFCMPVPWMNILNGGLHAENGLLIQELMIAPVGAPSFQEGLRWGVEVFCALRSVLRQKNLSLAVGDEGGFAPLITHPDQAMEYILHAVDQVGFQAGKDIVLGLDVASSVFYQNHAYHWFKTPLDVEAWLDVVSSWVRQYPVVSLEDAMSENDWAGWRLLTERLGHHIQLVGDDVFVTQTAWLQKGIDQKIANAILIKPNQVGTLTETQETIALAHRHGYSCMISHRSGETLDACIADLAVACGAGHIKTGAPCRGERVAKYNRLLAIEQELSRVPYGRQSEM